LLEGILTERNLFEVGASTLTLALSDDLAKPLERTARLSYTASSKFTFLASRRTEENP